jgi:hypothetical protein
MKPRNPLDHANPHTAPMRMSDAAPYAPGAELTVGSMSRPATVLIAISVLVAMSLVVTTSVDHY